MGSIIQGLLIGFSIFAINILLLRKNRKIVKPDNQGNYQMRLNRYYFVVGILFNVAGLAMIWGFIFSEKEDAPIFGIILGLLMSIFGIISLIWYARHKVVFNSEEVIINNFWGERKAMKWSEIHSIEFNGQTMYIELMTKSIVKAKFHLHLKGLVSFVDMMEKNTRWTAKHLDLPKYSMG